MYLKKLKLKNFRSWSTFEINFAPGLNTIIGPNASGKTNILEGIYFLATTHPLPQHRFKDIIKQETTAAAVEGVVVDTSGYEHLLNINLVVEKDKLRQAFLVGKTRVNRSQFLRELKVIFFEPNDLYFISGSPSRRRRVINRFLSDLDWQYNHNLAIYQKILRQRNNLLYQIKTQGLPTSRLWPWNKSLLKQGSYLQQKREELVRFFNSQQEKKGRPVRLKYQKSYLSPELIEDKEKLYQEIERGTTLWGPHRDDFIFLWQDQPLATFGSRGQQRLAYLWFFLSQRDWSEKENKTRPLLLLDDLFAELDPNFALLFKKEIEKDQAIITDVEERSFLSGGEFIHLK